MKNKKWIFRKGLTFVFSLFLCVFIYLSVFHVLLYNEGFYDHQFEKNGVFEQFGEETTLKESQQVLNYMSGEENDLMNSVFFSQRDKDHMVDVRFLIQITYVVKWVFFLLFLVPFAFLLFFYKKAYQDVLHDLFEYSGLFLIWVPVTLGVLQLFFQRLFTWAFTVFHEMTFANDLWILDPAKDNLINLFPEPFFFAFVVKLFVWGVLFGIFLIICSRFVKQFIKLVQVLVADFMKWKK